MQKNIAGFDDFIWWIGVVEDRKDPLFLGRCKVRMMYQHTEDKQEIPTEDLPWAVPSLPLDNGTNVVGPKEGDVVWGFYLDGVTAQQPVMAGYYPGIPEDPANPKIGFNDPRTKELIGHKVPRDPEVIEFHDDGSGITVKEIPVKSAFPDVRYLKESTASRYERDEKISESIVAIKEEAANAGQQEVPTANHPASGVGSDLSSPGDTFSEPMPPYDAKYPYNHAYYSEGGHLIEIDDTPNHERLHWYHRKGGFKEVHPDGTQVEKVTADSYEVVLKSKNTHIEANENRTIDKAFKLLVNKDAEESGNLDIEVGENGDFNITVVTGNLNVYVQRGDVNICVYGNANMRVTEDLNVEVGGNYNVSVGGDMNTTVTGNVNSIVGQNRTETIGQKESKSIGCGLYQFVGGESNMTFTGNLRQQIMRSWLVMCGGSKDEKVLGSSTLTVGQLYQITTMTMIQLVTGVYSITALTLQKAVVNLTWGIGTWIKKVMTEA